MRHIQLKYKLTLNTNNMKDLLKSPSSADTPIREMDDVKKHRPLDAWMHGVLSAITTTATSEKEFRKMTVTVFSILLSALFLWLIYFTYLMFGDFFTGAFLAIIVSIPLERKKRHIIDTLHTRISNVPSLKTSRNAMIFQFWEILYESAEYFTKSAGKPIIPRIIGVWESIVNFFKDLIDLLLGDVLSLILLVFVYICIIRSSTLMAIIMIGIFLVADILIRLIVDFYYYVMRIVHTKICSLFETEDKPISILTYGISGTLIFISILILSVLIGILVTLLILEIGELKELGVYIYGIIETWLKQSNIAHYLIFDNEELSNSIRRFAIDYGEDIKQKLSIPMNLTAIINGTKIEVHQELIRDANLIINSTFALDTSSISDILHDATQGNVTVASFLPIVQANLSKVFFRV